MITDSKLDRYPRARQAFDYLERNYVIYHHAFEYIRTHFDDEYLALCEALLRIVDESGCGLEGGLKALIRYSHEYLTLQARLNKDGRYLYSSFAEVNARVYQSEVMDEYYLDGLFLSQVLWPNHYRIGQYFLSLKSETNASSRLLDVPAGPGIYSFYIVEYFDFGCLESADISPRAISYTDRVLKGAAHRGKNIALRVADVLGMESPDAYDFICCGELLEHMENPRRLLDKLRGFLKSDGLLFLTAAIYAAAIDHIYLVKSVKEMRAMLGEFFEIDSELILPVSLAEYGEGMDPIPINYACVLRK